ncbi:hypothetical protein LTR84_006308 [Exophiala bonariae]|uniref:AB hydrolase-1 domain-containing protein n=1 Tax=Exophiala bonariae TaxID=1690606 RepID=A0AAV9N1I5_9EURO|nr:hypothetical protein LTR84_006308 [Exophiala bonariae]
MAERKPPLPPRRYSHAPSEPQSQSVMSVGESTQYLSPTAPLSPSIPPADKNFSPYSGGLHDPRASSTQSLRPIESATNTGRRTLLIIYIHGFLGDETSFGSFPAHVHSLITSSLAETHVVYTKVYPRYKSRKNVSFAKDDFSNWLAPHESDTTDVILVGHSLGGILAAEVVLIPSHVPGSNELSQHRLLGLIAFDVPYLGMHPGVVGTGIASLFRSPPELPESPLSTATEFAGSLSPLDSNFNPAYPNDVHLANRQGKLERAWYFWNKHAGELMNATTRYVSSHLEFGGVLADYPGLRRRYFALRALEDVDELARPRAPNGRLIRRVRFVNYYSASSGRIKERSPSPPASPALLEPPNRTTEMQTLSSRRSSADGTDHSLTVPPSPSPRLSLEEHRDGEVITKDIAELNIDPAPPLNELEPMAMGSGTTSNASGDESELVTTETQSPLSPMASSSLQTTSRSFDDGLPPLPPPPIPPPHFDESSYDNEDNLKIARKDHERQVKAYERALKDRAKSAKDREKVIQKRQREVIKQEEKEAKRLRQEELRVQKEQLKRSSTLNPEDYDKHLRLQTEVEQNSPQRPKKQKDRKFCALPVKDSRTGQRDPTWIRVYMEGIDEVVAHTSMFKMSETYVKMVGDTAERIERWVADDATKRLLLAEMQHSGAPLNQ